ncbi:MAG TPA: DUF4388 domain-containing protein [Candidatus Polarisedimenticolia bacterium]|nr:DUF4388 domain-containing protein [Candidatus Polarisedimenticolia bacterium]
MALEGTLRDFSLADIFQLIGIQKKTGVLTLKKSGEVVTVAFLNGCVVSADSLNKNLEDRLGHVLVKSGRISETRLQEALRIQKETLQRLGYVLVHGGFIKDEDLKEALRLQITQIVYRLFRWKDGFYHFSQEETVEYDRENFNPLSAENILMEGIRMIDEWPIIERKIKSFDMVFRKTHSDLRPAIVDPEEDDGPDLDTALKGAADDRTGEPDGDAPRMARDEACIYDLINGQRPVQEVIDRGRMGDFETCRILYDLLSRNLIVSSDAPAARTAVARRPRLAPILEQAGYLLVAGAVAASLATMGGSPFSGMPRHLIPAGSVERIQDLVARNRVQRLDEAVQVYYLQKGFYPDDLKELVKGRLVGEQTLRDPWGRSFGFISTTEGYRIIAYEPGGVENPARSLGRARPPIAMPGGEEPGPPSASLPSR